MRGRWRVRLRPLDEQVVVLVGASTGIGRATALLLARRGARVVVSARSEAALASLVSEISAGGGAAVAVPVDTRRPDDLVALAAEAVAEYGGIDTWVHLAAVSVYSRFEDLTPKEWKRVVDVDLSGQAYGAMAALPWLRERGGGSLVHVSSVLARTALPLQAPYCAAKHGIDGFVRSLRQELRREGAPIQVVQILPATIATPFFDKSRSKLGVRPAGPPPVYAPEVVARCISHAASHRVGDLHAGGSAVAMLAMERVSRRLNERVLAVVGDRFQRTSEVRPPDAPDAVVAPLPDCDAVRSSLPWPMFRHSAVSWSERHPVATTALGGAAVAAVRSASLRNGGRRSGRRLLPSWPTGR